MGFWSNLWDRVTGAFERVESSAPIFRDTTNDGGGDAGSGEVTDDTFVTESDNPPGQENFPFDFSLAGYLELGADYGSDYVNLEGEIINLTDQPWETMDYFVIKVSEPGRDDYYTTIVGNFDDYDDLLDAIAEWWEQGS